MSGIAHFCTSVMSRVAQLAVKLSMTANSEFLFSYQLPDTIPFKLILLFIGVSKLNSETLASCFRRIQNVCSVKIPHNSCLINYPTDLYIQNYIRIHSYQ